MRFARIFFVFATVGVLCTPVVWSQNLLSNPGFESGTLSGWSGGGTVHGSSWFWGAGPHTGTYAWGSVSNYLVGDDTVQQTVPVTAGVQYSASGWFWLYSVAANPAATGGEITVQWLNGSGGTISTNTSGWYDAATQTQQVYFQISNSWTAPVGAVQARFIAHHVADGQGGGFWAVATADDFVFAPACPAPAMTYMRNWSFEDLDPRGEPPIQNRTYRAWTRVDGQFANWQGSGHATDGTAFFGWAYDGGVYPMPSTGYRQVLDALPGPFTARLDWEGFAEVSGGPTPVKGDDADARMRWVITAYTASGCSLGSVLGSWDSGELQGTGSMETLTLCGTFPATTRLVTVDLRVAKVEQTAFHIHVIDAVELDSYGPPFTTVTSPTYLQEIDDDDNLVCSGYVYMRTHPVTTQTQVRIMRTTGSTDTYWNGSGWVSNSNTWVSATTQPGSNGGPWSYTLPAAQVFAGDAYTVSARSYDSQSNAECYMDEIEALAVVPVPGWELYVR